MLDDDSNPSKNVFCAPPFCTMIGQTSHPTIVRPGHLGAALLEMMERKQMRGRPDDALLPIFAG